MSTEGPSIRLLFDELRLAQEGGPESIAAAAARAQEQLADLAVLGVDAQDDVYCDGGGRAYVLDAILRVRRSRLPLEHLNKSM